MKMFLDHVNCPPRYTKEYLMEMQKVREIYLKCLPKKFDKMIEDGESIDAGIVPFFIDDTIKITREATKKEIFTMIDECIIGDKIDITEYKNIKKQLIFEE